MSFSRESHSNRVDGAIITEIIVYRNFTTDRHQIANFIDTISSCLLTRFPIALISIAF